MLVVNADTSSRSIIDQFSFDCIVMEEETNQHLSGSTSGGGEKGTKTQSFMTSGETLNSPDWLNTLQTLHNSQQTPIQNGGNRNALVFSSINPIHPGTGRVGAKIDLTDMTKKDEYLDNLLNQEIIFNALNEVKRNNRRLNVFLLGLIDGKMGSRLLEEETHYLRVDLNKINQGI